jgi:hypothetical protein
VLRVPEKSEDPDKSSPNDAGQIAVIPIFPDDGKYTTLMVKQWQPGCGSGDRPEAWCLGESFATFFLPDFAE